MFRGVGKRLDALKGKGHEPGQLNLPEPAKLHHGRVHKLDPASHIGDKGSLAGMEGMGQQLQIRLLIGNVGVALREPANDPLNITHRRRLNQEITEPPVLIHMVVLHPKGAVTGDPIFQGTGSAPPWQGVLCP